MLLFRFKHRSFFMVSLSGIFGLLFLAIGPCTRSNTQEEITFLLGWSDKLPDYANPGYQSGDQARKIADKAEVKLREELDRLNDRISFELPDELYVDENVAYPIMKYRRLRQEYRDKILGRISDRVETDVPLPREATQSMNPESIRSNLTRLHLLDMLVNTFQGFSFTDIRLSDAKPSRNQRVKCELVEQVKEYTFNFDFSSSLEETLRWIDRLRSDAGFFYIKRITINPDPDQPGFVRVKSFVTSLELEQAIRLDHQPIRLEK